MVGWRCKSGHTYDGTMTKAGNVRVLRVSDGLGLLVTVKRAIDGPLAGAMIPDAFTILHDRRWRLDSMNRRKYGGVPRTRNEDAESAVSVCAVRHPFAHSDGKAVGRGVICL